MEPDKLTDLEDKAWMREALKLADLAAAEGEVPVGAVIVKDGVLISAGRNRRELGKNALYHAELEAIDGACKALGGWRLWQCDLYIALEPCPMCTWRYHSDRLDSEALRDGAKDPKAGSCGSIVNLFELPYNHKPQVISGVLEEACAERLSGFFRSLRERKKNGER
ncbi:MAG: nucleoside deaminase [[Clostridium] leptum]